ncbi:hypothetical protein LNTAR_01035 [Lentisphaera araneosa HTCC2155]|uniref:Uncharacterized protein n=1 Tax=Lentisphaera araneosa HTCC2155 TaxID=313628 RepID=A6DKP4_9BACT|nr:hypothetical protein [Lentisphaera araneosa]EDM27942.1 hypothetical protein LNTAR_01035 [Lentisphaera araneosa HTCC2155]
MSIKLPVISDMVLLGGSPERCEGCHPQLADGLEIKCGCFAQERGAVPLELP